MFNTKRGFGADIWPMSKNENCLDGWNVYQKVAFLRIRTFPDIVDKRYHYKRKL